MAAEFGVTYVINTRPPTEEDLPIGVIDGGDRVARWNTRVPSSVNKSRLWFRIPTEMAPAPPPRFQYQFQLTKDGEDVFMVLDSGLTIARAMGQYLPLNVAQRLANDLNKLNDLSPSSIPGTEEPVPAPKPLFTAQQMGDLTWTVKETAGTRGANRRVFAQHLLKHEAEATADLLNARATDPEGRTT